MNTYKIKIFYNISVVASICVLILYGMTYFPKLSPTNGLFVAVSTILSIYLFSIANKILIKIRNINKDRDLFEYVIVRNNKWIKYLLLLLLFNIILSFFMLFKLENGGFSPTKRGEKYIIEYRGSVREVTEEESYLITAGSYRVFYSFCILANLISLVILEYTMRIDNPPQSLGNAE